MESRKVGLELLRMERVSQAHAELQKAVEVTPMMARELIEELKRMGVSYVVAPYEADSQMAYLEKKGIIDGVLSEDSDLLVFGVKCLLTKLDQYGECVMINRADFTACREVSLAGWSDKEFRMMAMLSGCDYLPGIDKMGLKTAHRLVRKHKTLDRVVRAVQFDGKMRVPAGYIESFTRAERTFLFQWVFCQEDQCLVNLNPIPADLDVHDMPYIGKSVDAEVAVGVATGELDPNTKEQLHFASRHPQPQMRTRMVQTPDEKQGKPISEFFRPKRTPLAELDPNSFTPSPSQQRLLENQRATSWSASQVQTSNAPVLSRVASASAAAPSSAPQPARRAVSDQHRSLRQHASPKRQRLCSESVLAASMEGSVGLQSATSRFFNKQSAQPSPSLRKASKQKEKERDEFDLWSDDSVAEAADVVASQAELAPSPKKRKKLQIFEDPEADQSIQATRARPSVSASQSTSSTTTTQTSQTASAGTATPATSFESVFSAGLNASFADMKAKWAFKPGTPRTAVSRSHTAPTPTRIQVASGDLASHRRSGTPVRTTPPVSPIDTNEDVEVPTSSPILAPVAETAVEDDIDDEEWLGLEKRHIAPDPLVLTKGSEDLLVPASPGSETGISQSRPKLNLGRFAFAG